MQMLSKFIYRHSIPVCKILKNLLKFSNIFLSLSFANRNRVFLKIILKNETCSIFFLLLNHLELKRPFHYQFFSVHLFKNFRPLSLFHHEDKTQTMCTEVSNLSGYQNSWCWKLPLSFFLISGDENTGWGMYCTPHHAPLFCSLRTRTDDDDRLK